jgi:polar amino acid transport system substrate-binding protein
MFQMAIHHCFRRLASGLCAVTVTLLLPVSIAQAGQPSLVVYAESNSLDSWPVQTDEGEVIEGYATDLVRSLLTKIGYEADIRIVPWPRLMNFLLNEPNVLGFNMTRTFEREEQFQWIGEIRPVEFQLWGIKERLNELPRTLAEAREYRVAAYRNDVVEQYLLSEGFTNIVYVTDSFDSVAMLQRRRIDFLPYSALAMEDFKTRNEYARNEIVPLIDLEAVSTAHYLVMSKNSDRELVIRLMDTFQSMVESGEHAKLLNLLN